MNVKCVDKLMNMTPIKHINDEATAMYDPLVEKSVIC